jgi:hypothetical protein
MMMMQATANRTCDVCDGEVMSLLMKSCWDNLSTVIAKTARQHEVLLYVNAMMLTTLMLNCSLMLLMKLPLAARIQAADATH